MRTSWTKDRARRADAVVRGRGGDGARAARPRFAGWIARIALAAALLPAALPASAQNLFESEPNDSPSDFFVQVFNPATAALRGDFDDCQNIVCEDWWEFNATAGNTYTFLVRTISCSFLVDVADPGFYVANSSGTPVSAFVDVFGDCANEGLTWVAPSSGTFYLVIYEATGTPTTGIVDYEAIPNVFTPTPTPTPQPTASPTPTPSPTPPVNVGNGRDVPTWQVGDYWDFVRTLRVDLDSDSLFAAAGFPLTGTDAYLDIVDTHRLQVTAIQDENTTESGSVTPQRMYVRQRVSGSLTAVGMLDLGTSVTAGPFPLELTGTILNEGETWNRVSDLADTHERFRFTGTVTAHGDDVLAPFSATTDLLALDLVVNIDYDPPQEWGDFPIAPSLEQWVTQPTVRVHGSVVVDFPTIGSGAAGMLDLFSGFGGSSFPAPADLTVGFDASQSIYEILKYSGDAMRQGYSSSQLFNPMGAEVWYAPNAKEFVEKRLGDLVLVDTSGGPPVSIGTLEGIFTRINGAASVAADPLIGNLAFNPVRGVPGGTVTLTGLTSPSQGVTATVMATGASASTTANGSGVFSLVLPVPTFDDHSPATADGGSFGVLIETGIGDKVATLQVQGAGLTPATPGWEEYE